MQQAALGDKLASTLWTVRDRLHLPQYFAYSPAKSGLS